jgi:hypothetical protein
MEATILRREVYKQLQSGEPFDMVFITADRRRKTGGEIVNATGWMVCGSSEESSKPAVKSSKPKAQSSEEDVKETKDPHHKDRGTINIYNPANSGIHPISVHFDLIQFFNGKRAIN